MMLYQSTKFSDLVKSTAADAVIWTFRNNPAVLQKPEAYGWVRSDGTKAREVSIKKPISATPMQDHAIVGAFSFASADLVFKAGREVVAKNRRVNGEFYVDSVMQLLVEQHFNIHVFEIDYYLGWGTPEDYQTFLYWQRYFTA
jgi:hypothetical protein